jgi:hypothetical protein
MGCNINAVELTNLSLCNGFGMFVGVARSYTNELPYRYLFLSASAPLREIISRKGEYGA